MVLPQAAYRVPVLTCSMNGIDNKNIIANPGVNRKENGYKIVTLVAPEKGHAC